MAQSARTGRTLPIRGQNVVRSSPLGGGGGGAGVVVDGAADSGEQGGFGEWFFQEVDLAGEGAVGVQDVR